MLFFTTQQLLQHSTDTFLVPTVISAQEAGLCYFHNGSELLKELGVQISGEGTLSETINKYNSFLASFYLKMRMPVLVFSNSNEQMNHPRFLIRRAWGWRL